MKGRLAHLIGMLLTIIAMGGIVEAGSDDKKGIADLDFSWDTVPKFLYISGKKQFTPEELDYIARNFYWVTFAIGFGGDDHETYDEALGFAAAELKKIHPRIKVLYYWNAARCIHNYGEIGEEFEKHPEWDISKGAMGFNKNRIPIRLQKGKTTPEVNVADPGARRWWLDNAFRALDLPYIDGLRVDATARIYNTGARKTLERAGIFEESEKGLHLMYGELAKYYRKNNGLLIGNFLREHDDYPYEQIWPYFDGSFVENHYNLIGEEIPLKEYGEKISSIIQKTRMAARNGKIAGFYAGGAFDPFYDSKKYSMEERKRKLARHFEYNLALYLILAEKGVYFEYNDGFRTDVHAWNVEYPEYSYQLGAPKGDAVRSGNIYKRNFAHASVMLDIENRAADIIWRKDTY